MIARFGGAVALAAVLAGCGGGEDTLAVRGSFAAGTDAPAVVRAMESGREAAVSEGGFELADLTAGPLTLRLTRGEDILGTLEIPDLPAGATLTLHGLRVDETSGRAFPTSVDLDGGDVVSINGIRFAPVSRIPSEVDHPGAVLAFSPEDEAMLVRPSDAGLPDLRVVLTGLTEIVTPDGDPVDVEDLAPGDSVRVVGATDQGYVIASRLIVPRRLAVSSASSGDDASSDDGGSDAASSDDDDGSGGGGDGRSSSPSSPAITAPPPPAPRLSEVIRDRPGRGEGRGNARGRGAERGGGRGGKKPKD